MKHLLITDDDHLITKIFKERFESAGYQVSATYSGADTIEFLKHAKPDAVILDLVLPDMSGVDVLKYIRSKSETRIIPVFVVSNSYCFSGIVQSAWSAGATKFINKEECEIEELITQIDSLINPLEITQAAANSPSEIVNYNILLADDDLVIHGVLEYFLKQGGFIVRSAFDGAQALKMTISSPPDLIILDGIMPEMDGFNVVEKLKEIPELSKIPIIMMTAVKDDSIKERMTELGVVEYLVKPFNLNLLVKLVEQHITKQLANS